MTLETPLCALPLAPPSGCCDVPPAPPAAPIVPYNPPGLSAIRYRIGTFTAFRQAMLDRVPDPSLLAPGSPNPFAAWGPGAAYDYQTSFVELWAYILDVLTFYQERIANEAYLPTATQRDSLRRLAATIGYRPSPGAGADVLLAFTVDAGKTVTVPAGLRCANKPAPGQTRAVFETSAAFTALGDHNAIALSQVAPTNQFAPLSAFAVIFGLGHTLGSIEDLAHELYGGAGGAYLRARINSFTGYVPHVVLPAHLEPAENRTIKLEGDGNRLSVGDYVLVVENDGTAQESATPYALTQVTVDKVAKTTSVSWNEPSTKSYTSDWQSIAVYALRIKAGAFGATAPAWSTVASTGTSASSLLGSDANSTSTTITVATALSGDQADGLMRYGVVTLSDSTGLIERKSVSSAASTTITLTSGLSNSFTVANSAAASWIDGPYFGRDWDDASIATPATWYYLPIPTPQPGSGQYVFLDGVYKGAHGIPPASLATWHGWAVLVADGQPALAMQIDDAQDVSNVGHSVSAKVTRLTVDVAIPIPASTYPVRTSTIYAGSETLTLHNNLPLPEPLLGQTLVLAGIYPKLQTGQTVIVSGFAYDPTTKPPSQTPCAEAAALAAPPLLDTTDNVTIVTLRSPLSNAYAREGGVLYANVVDATQGETVRTEIVGSGNGTANQAFALAKKPLTYLPGTDAQGLSSVQSTLILTVNGVQWAELVALVESEPGAQVFSSTQDDLGSTITTFGDGVHGAAPPTGKDNIRARYRAGIGTSGNVPSGSVQQLVDSTPGLQKVRNPLPSLGGTDPDNPAQIRLNAPATVRTFGRAVGAQDYSALALSYPGIAKASAAWTLRDGVTLKALAHPYLLLTVAATNLVPLAQQLTFALKLRAFLDTHRDPNVPLIVSDYTPVFVDVAAVVDIDDRYPQQATLATVRSALNAGLNPDGSAGYFAFQSLQLGESIHLSAVYAAIQAVPGVADATITTLRKVPDDVNPSTVRDDIFLRPTELATVANDPADTTDTRGKVQISLGHGGFAD